MTPSLPDAELVSLDQQLCFKLYAASRLVIKAYKPLLNQMSVTYPQYLVLMVLWQAPTSVTIGYLGERLLLDTGTLTPLLKRMEQQGLLSRSRGIEDERQVWVELTQAGIQLQAIAIDWVKTMTGATKEQGIDVATLKAQLDLLLSALN